jgi:hypothetical protein
MSCEGLFEPHRLFLFIRFSSILGLHFEWIVDNVAVDAQKQRHVDLRCEGGGTEPANEIVEESKLVLSAGLDLPDD